MTFDELSFDQCVIWTNKAGTRIPARVTDILPSHNEAQIRVTHEGGLQHLRVRPETLEADTAARDAARKARAKAWLKDKPKAGKAWTTKTYEYDRGENDGR